MARDFAVFLGRPGISPEPPENTSQEKPSRRYQEGSASNKINVSDPEPIPEGRGFLPAGAPALPGPQAALGDKLS